MEYSMKVSKGLFKGPLGMLPRETEMRLPLMVLQSAKGFYLGTADNDGPVSRESVEYWANENAAKVALSGSEGKNWTQRTEA